MTPLLQALRVGVSLSNQTRWKWFGAAMLGAVIALRVAQMFGFALDISDTDLVELVALTSAFYTQIATTEKIGIPSKRGK